MTLEGPWTDDNNMAPICDNDYHWNNEQELQEWDDGKLHLPWTSSPEYHGIDETLRWPDKKEPACHVHEVLTAMSEGGEKGTFTDILSVAGKQISLNSGAYTITKGWSADHPFVMQQ